MKPFLVNITITFLLLLLLSGYSRASDPPLLTCLEVHDSGDVTVYWQSTDLTAHQFLIYYSLDKSTWAYVDAVDIPNTSMYYHHTTALANDQVYYYYITAVYPNGDSIDSGEHGTIFLGVTYGGLNNTNEGIASLGWTETLPLPVGSVNNYNIYRAVTANNFELIANNITNPSYIDTIDNGICNDSISYKVEMDNTYGCSSVSNIAGKYFHETRQPEKPILDSVSILNDSHIIIGWTKSISTDVEGTIIYKWDNNIWETVDTVFGSDNTHYVDSSYQPCNSNFMYSIAAFDSCSNASPKTEVTAQRSIFLYEINNDLCSETNSLSWEAYINSTPGIEKYEIWYSTNNGIPVIAGEVPPNETYYDHSGVDNSTQYDYFIRAVYGNYSSTSCIKSVTTGNFLKPDTLYLANANVLPDNNIELTINIDLAPNKCNWEINRSDAGGGIQSLLTSINRNEVSNSPLVYLDEAADGSTGYYTYSINVFDSCGAASIYSNTMKTIFLEGEQLSDYENYLQWNAFEGFDGGVDKYYIYRILDEIIPTHPIDSTNAQTTEYTDNTSSVTSGEKKFSYWVQAAEGNHNNSSTVVLSNSNIINLYRETDFYFANAFLPGSTNNSIFKPISSGFGGSNYLFQIYNRWGQLIYETTNPQSGWDGYHNSNPAPNGTYVYQLIYQSVFGITKQQQGTVTLINH